MAIPNQLTVCAFGTRQGVYIGTVRMYDEAEGRYGLLYKEYYFGKKTRDRKVAIATGREVVKKIKNLSAIEQRAWLETNGDKQR